MGVGIPPLKRKVLFESNPLKSIMLVGKLAMLGTKDCTPEIDTLEIIVDCQWHFPTGLHLSVVFSKGLSLGQWIFSGIVQWISVAFSN